MPALVDGLKVARFQQQAGGIGRLMQCLRSGLRRIPDYISGSTHQLENCRPLSSAGLIGMDLLSMLVKNPFALMGTRFLHGLSAGCWWA